MPERLPGSCRQSSEAIRASEEVRAAYLGDAEVV